jgi:acetyltransferase-like isoleucine patch superfamily enzyme
MNVTTEPDCVGVINNHPWSAHFQVIGYSSGGHSCLPHRLFRTWLDEHPGFGAFHIGRCSGIGIGSVVKYDAFNQSMRLGRFSSAGLNCRFMLNGQHDTRTISTCMFSVFGMGLRNVPPPQYGDSILKNDVWMGDEVMMLGGGVVENGCIIGAQSRLSPNFRSEPYGVYAGAPARLLSFRFSEDIREKLLELAWWDMPLSWIKDNNDFFLMDLTADEGKSLEALAQLKERKLAFECANALAAG